MLKQVSQTEKSGQNLPKNTWAKRPQLRNTFILIDARIPPQQIDLDFINWMGEKGVPFSIVFTKNDKPKKTLANI